MTRVIDQVTDWLEANPGREFRTTEMADEIKYENPTFRNRASTELKRLSKYGYCEKIGETRAKREGGREYIWMAAKSEEEEAKE